MKSHYFLALAAIMLLIGTNSNAMWCIKDGKKYHYDAGFEPCRYYWDKVVNDDGTPFKGHYAPIPPCRPKLSIINTTTDQLQDQDIDLLQKSSGNEILLGSEIAREPIEGSGYLVKYKGECIGFYKQLADFYKDKESAKKMNTAR